jgi:L-phenylalanine/L-methionine N-acetyltransferase
MTISIRAAEPNDYEAIHQIFLSPQVIWGTLQLPFPSAEMWRKRLTDSSEGMFRLVACLEKELVGHLDIRTFPNFPRRRHVGQIGMAVRDEFQHKGIGTALLQAAVDLSDKWLNILRLELEVYSDHEPAVRLYKRFGFAIEGTLVRYAYRAGQYVDVYTMARFKQD